MNTVDILDRLERYVVAQGYAGYDPYDALSSPLLRRLPGGRLRQAAIQVSLRSPVNIRPALRVPHTKMSKALALFASGYAVRNRPGDADRALRLTDDLLAQRSQAAWGYEFDVQTRWGYYPRSTPNVIATAFVIEALHDVDRIGDVPAEVVDWLLSDVRSAGDFGYYHGADRAIHNANLLGARALNRISPSHPAVVEATELTLSAQRADGLWPYGEGEGLGWVDNFHTAYVLLCLADLRETVPSAKRALLDGLDGWTNQCFSPNGTPRYYADRQAKSDVHNVATALLTVATFASEHDRCAALLPSALATAAQMQRTDGAFVAMPRGLPYMRWNQAHMFRALCELTK